MPLLPKNNYNNLHNKKAADDFSGFVFYTSMVFFGFFKI